MNLQVSLAAGIHFLLENKRSGLRYFRNVEAALACKFITTRIEFIELNTSSLWRRLRKLLYYQDMKNGGKLYCVEVYTHNFLEIIQH